MILPSHDFAFSDFAKSWRAKSFWRCGRGVGVTRNPILSLDLDFGIERMC